MACYWWLCLNIWGLNSRFFRGIFDWWWEHFLIATERVILVQKGHYAYIYIYWVMLVGSGESPRCKYKKVIMYKCRLLVVMGTHA